MTYKLKFLPVALKEWEKLGAPVRAQFKKKLAERLEEPHVLTDKLRGHESVYKIKLRSLGYRLVYLVENSELTVCVIAVGKREKGKVYRLLKSRN